MDSGEERDRGEDREVERAIDEMTFEGVEAGVELRDKEGRRGLGGRGAGAPSWKHLETLVR